MRVLIIEDDANIRNNMAEMLELENYEPITFNNGTDGIQDAINHPPDVILCDLMMPNVDGYAVIEAIRNHEATKHIPIIIVTARTERDAIQKGMETGATDYLLKPFTTKNLLDVLESLK